MSDTKAPIVKSPGFTETERFLSDLCERTFLRLWSYPNPFKAPGKELCDVIAVFDHHVFLFFDRFHGAFERDTDEVMRSWERWKKEAIDKQFKTAHNAVKHVLRDRRAIFVDAKAQVPLPVTIPTGDITIHSIIVAHGAADACKAFSPNNISGSLAVVYADSAEYSPMLNNLAFPFMVDLSRNEIVHVLDGYTLELILGELDTFFDFSLYINAKEAAIRNFKLLLRMLVKKTYWHITTSILMWKHSVMSSDHKKEVTMH